MVEISAKHFSKYGEGELCWNAPEEYFTDPEVTPIFPLIWDTAVRALQAHIEHKYPSLNVPWERIYDGTDK